MLAAEVLCIVSDRPVLKDPAKFETDVRIARSAWYAEEKAALTRNPCAAKKGKRRLSAIARAERL